MISRPPRQAAQDLEIYQILSFLATMFTALATLLASKEGVTAT